MMFKQLTRYRKSFLTASILGLASFGSTRAADVTLDFSTDPTLSGQVTLFGNAIWRDTGGNPGGYLSLTDAANSQRSTIVFSDLDNGLVVKAFSFGVDVRIGGGTETPADGFSINYVRAGDDVLDDGDGWSDIGNTGDLNLPEEGAKTGLAVGFDAYLSGGGTVTDVIGLSVRVDNQLLAQYPFSVLNGALTDTNSLQTGPRNPAFDPAVNPIEDSWANLGWARFEVDLTEDGKLTIRYKGREVTPAGGLQTPFFPSPGQLVFAGRTGALNQNTHVDNIQIKTVAAELPFFTGLSGTAAGFIFQLSDGSTEVVTNSIAVKLNGTTVPLTTVAKEGPTTTGTYAPAQPLIAGMTNTVEVTFTDTANRSSTNTRTFVVRNYAVLTPADAVPANSIDRTAPGFTARVHQLPIGRFPGDANSIQNAERHLANRYIDFATGQPYTNRADLTGANNGVFTIPTVINWNQDANTATAPENIGNFQDDSDPSRPDAQIPGIPGTVLNEDGSFYTDNIAAEVLTFLELKRGLYRFGVNSDDGFRVTAGTGYRDIYEAPLGSFNGGKGSSDELFDVWVEQDGVYPFRLAWWEGGGGANLEFFTLNEATGQKILINDTAVTGYVPAFRTSSAPSQPYVTYVSPAVGEAGTFPNATITVDIRDGSLALNDSTVAVTLNGAPLTTSVANSGTLTTVTAPVTTLLQPNTTNTVVLSYQATGSSVTTTHTWTFVTAPTTTLATAQMSPVGSGDNTKPGFNARIYQLEPYLDAAGALTGMATELYYADALFSGAAGANVADLSTASDGLFAVETVINLNADEGNAGAFPDDARMPGIPGLGTANTTDNIAGEFTTYIEFPTAGVYRMGVNSDDGFRLTASETRGNYLLNVLAPAAVAGPEAAVLSARGLAGGSYGPLPSSPITADVFYAGEACGEIPNGAQIAGKILLVDRGTCGFVVKALNAQATNGAVAMIIINNNPGFPIVAGGGTDEITIPVMMISQAAGAELKANLTGLRMTISAETAPVLSEANVGRGSDGSFYNGTLATINVPQAGVYPFRLLWMEGGGGANVEWYSITPEGEGILVNDRSNPRALRAFRARTAVTRPTLSLSRDGGTLSVEFTGTLQASSDLAGEWNNVATSSPANFQADGQMRFFRAVQ
ncbi:MAG TPA: PA domain-containing protein [Verrucomicrobiae bacterium]